MIDKMNDNTPIIDIKIFTAEAIATALISAIAIILNLIVAAAFFKGKELRTPASLFLANLTLTDLICSLSLMIEAVLNFILLQLPLEVNSLNGICKFSNYLSGLSYIALSATLSGLSIERYNVIVRTKSRGINLNKAKLLIIIIWIYGVVTAIPLGFTVGTTFILHTNGKNYSRCVLLYEHSTFNAVFYIIGFFALFLVPFLSILFAYYKIALRIYHNKRPGQSAVRVVTAREKRKRQQVVVLFTMTVTFMLSSLPYIGLLVIVALTNFTKFPSIRKVNCFGLCSFLLNFFTHVLAYMIQFYITSYE